MGRSIHELTNLSTHPRSDNTTAEEVMQTVMGQQTDSSRIVVLHGEVNENSISMVIAGLLGLANVSHKPIHLVVSTYGGSIDEMFMLYDTIKFLPCPVHTVALGKVMSAGVLLIAAGVKGKRMIGSSARVMIHPVSGGVFGNVFEVVNETNEQLRLQKLLIETLAKETKMTVLQVEKIMKAGHDYYITAHEAVKLGIVDSIIGEKSVIKNA